ncbi:hypothetical protein H0H81_006313 [Sphagnurus paluster]|uniref:Up-regulated during septation protein 1 domain-containing protein n=1 Tax=Sphagnurus paluster TaxID=117069 RepID=A0A9P7KIY7_9AGAR|nr:hypothetical protein H0H81_006313 [Sphagnurus paluster]
MNGVRRLLGAAAAATSSSLPQPAPPPPPAPSDTDTVVSYSSPGASWPPQSPTVATPPTPALNFKKDPSRQRPQPQDAEPSRVSFESVFRDLPSSPSSSRTPPNPLTIRSSIPQSQKGDWRRESGGSNASGSTSTRDELLLSLLASQAVVDSREFEILASEQIDDLTKEHQLLTARLEAMSKKLTLETKIRDAAVSLAKVNAAQKKTSKQSEEQLEAANRRVDAAQQDLWRVSERAHEVHRRLLEHRAGVLSHSVRTMEKKLGVVTLNGTGPVTGEDSGYDSSSRNTLLSPTTSSMSGFSSSSRKVRFDGRHYFAGHAEAIVPRRQLSPEAAALEITSLEEKLKAATASLKAAGKKQVEMTRELSEIRMEKMEIETRMSFELQGTEEKTHALEEMTVEVRELREEKLAWAEERARLQQQAEVSETTRGATSDMDLEDARNQLREKEEEIKRIKTQWEEERQLWERRQSEAEDEKMNDLARLQQEMERIRDEDQQALQQAHTELDKGLDALRQLVTKHGIVLFSRDSSLQGLLSSVGTHLETVHNKLESHSRAEAEWESVRRKLEDDIRAGLDKRESLIRDLEAARRERSEAVPQEMPSPATKEAVLARSPILASSDSANRIIQLLTPLWNTLPSPEARAAKFNHSRQFRTGSPTQQNGASSKPVASLSELDVRSLKSLYDSTKQPASPVVGAGEFSIEAFAARVQALIQDDRALIERLLRFAQAHDLLKKNAERAQKLAQEGNTALETYQRQVRTLEERNMTMASKQAAMVEEMQELQNALERIESEKRDVEMLAAEQAETCRQLTEANNTLSARTLTLAEEAASAPEMVRKQLEGQLTETRAALEVAQDEVQAMRTSEQTQRIALLDELNSMQTENAQLRAQLRARK